MELINVSATFGDFIWPFILTFIIVYLLGMVMSNSEDWPGATALGVVLGLILGFTGVAAATDNRQADVITNFNITYGVVLKEGTIPYHANEMSAVVLYTSEGDEVCVVRTDDTHYSVNCGGAYLPPVNVNER